MTYDQDFDGTSLFDVDYLRNSTRHGHDYNGILIRTYNALLNDVISHELV